MQIGAIDERPLELRYSRTRIRLDSSYRNLIFSICIETCKESSVLNTHEKLEYSGIQVTEIWSL